MICPNCQSDNREGAKFCDECAFPLASATRDLSSVPAIFDEPEDDGDDDGFEVMVTDYLPGYDAGFEDEEDSRQARTRVIERVPAEDACDDDFDDDASILGAVGGGSTMRMPRIEADESAVRRDFRADPAEPEEEAPRHRRKRGLLIACAVVVVAAAIAGVTYMMELWGGHAVPDVVGKTSAEATALLEERGFSVRAMEVRSDDTEGIVLLTDPSSGSRAPAGSEVVIHVAVPRTVPDVVGMARADAEAELAACGYTNVTFELEKSGEAEGTVLSISPEAHTKAMAGTSIVVKVADPYRVPDVAGKTSEEAASLIEAETLVVSTAWEYAEDTPEGTVLRTDPAAGTTMQEGGRVTMYVAKHRSTELINATYDALAAGTEVTIGGTSYRIQSVDAVEYLGDDKTAVTLTAKPFTWFLGEKVYLSARSVSATVAWTNSNEISNIA